MRKNRIFRPQYDLHDLKHLVFELIRGNNLRVPDNVSYRAIPSVSGDQEIITREQWPVNTEQEIYLKKTTPLIIEDKKYENPETDENFALEDMEKDMIKKSLKRHGGRRKEAALELGISERTLYRKIKQYDI